MSNKKRKLCSSCLRPEKACYCHLLVSVNNEHTRICVLRHPDETKKPLGTANILKCSLSHCSVIDGIDFSLCDQVNNLIKAHKNQSAAVYLLYPDENSISLIDLNKKSMDLSRAAGDVVNVIVLDGTWRNTREILLTNPFLAELPRLSMAFPISRYRIRKAPEPGMVSTVEAVVYLLERVDGEKKRYTPILKAFDYLIDYQIKAMGTEVFNRNYSTS